MFPWGDAPAEVSGPTYAVGDIVYSGSSRGTVVSLDREQNCIGIVWDDSGERYGAITYPLDATYLRKALPWET